MKKKKKDYPILAIRISDEEIAYLRREAKERKMKVSKYVKAILLPIGIVVGK